MCKWAISMRIHYESRDKFPDHIFRGYDVNLLELMQRKEDVLQSQTFQELSYTLT